MFCPRFPHVMCRVIELIAPVFSVVSIRMVRVVLEHAVLGDALPMCPSHASPASVRRIAGAVDADCITGLSHCV